MRFLLDTHALLWAAYRRDLLSKPALDLLGKSRNEFFVSAASAWEIATKFRLGKLPHAQVLVGNFIPAITAAGYLLLPISVEHALRAGSLPGSHRDPFDRMLAGQSIHEDIPLLSNDERLDAFGVRRIW
ncbi:MAG TPA: type II toxin-antitoxin system VapC family toxin [Terracidiphilus sp.]|nr:type II toxin-antitoxin system VapC family toxin [Terracidiphilus sp.]